MLTAARVLLADDQGAPPAAEIVRLSLHVLAATVWVGGQIVLAGLVPVLRRASADAPRAAARAFNRIAWPAFVVLVGTGVWNVVAESPYSGTEKGVLMAKYTVVLLSGLAALLHQRSRSKAGLAVWGAASALTALAAVVLGITLAGRA